MGKANSPISINQAPQYGDKTAIDNVAKQTQPDPLTGTPMPVQTGGRPAGAAQPEAAAQPAVDIPAEHTDLANRMARMDWARGVWAQVAQQYPGEWTQRYASDADSAFNELATKFYRDTPNPLG